MKSLMYASSICAICVLSIYFYFAELSQFLPAYALTFTSGFCIMMMVVSIARRSKMCIVVSTLAWFTVVLLAIIHICMNAVTAGLVFVVMWTVIVVAYAKCTSPKLLRHGPVRVLMMYLGLVFLITLPIWAHLSAHQ